MKSILLFFAFLCTGMLVYGKKDNRKLNRMKLADFITGIQAASDANMCNTTKQPKASCDILEYAFKIPHDLRKASQWVIYKGLDKSTPCLIIVVERGHSKSYFKGKVFCANYCGWNEKERFQNGHMTNELKNQCDQNELEALSPEDAAALVNGQQEKTTLNKIIVPQDVVNQASYTSGNDAPFYFHILIGVDVKSKSAPKENLVMFDSLNKQGEHYLGKKVFVAGSAFYQRGLIPLD